LFKKEDIFVELSRNRYRRQRTFANLEKDIVKSEIIDDALREKVEEYTKFISDEKRGALAEYVTRRRAVIDLFEKFLEYKDAKQQNYQKEEAIHRLICPMKVESSQLEIEDHNLWLLDDRLAFFRYFASDKNIGSYTSVDGLERPDLAFFYDSCVAWREGENSDTVVLVEFKKPMRDDYTSGRDPVQQVLLYVKKLRTESAVPDFKGKAIRGVNQSTAFHCYVVADITPTLEERIIGRFSRTPDGQGYFGYSPDPPAFVEIVPYGKVLSDSKVRNTIFFKTLGITSEV
jgi:metal-responsive CopG/Arc/MetJ family transcriptional regulator